MPAHATMRRNAPGSGIAALLLVLVGCLSPHAPEPAADRQAPHTPNLTLLRAHVPDSAGVAWIRGAAGCVEAGVSVEVRESGTSHPRTVRTLANGAGAFEIGLSAALLARIEVAAVDAAGNASPAVGLAVGAPFQLSTLCNGTPAVAGDSAGIASGVRLTDESGAEVAGVDVSFIAATLSPVVVTAATGDDGVAVWQASTPTRSGAHALVASVPPALLATAVTCTLRVQPAEPDGVNVVAGSDQVGAPAAFLADALVCRVVDRFGNGIGDRSVEWTSAGGSLSHPSSITNADGEASVRWTLPATPGEWQATATLASTELAATFAGIAGGPPVITAVSPDPATPGADVVLDGGPFSRDPAYNEVWFESANGDHAASIQDVEPDRLVVRVPDDATSGNVHVRVCGREAVPAAVRIDLVLGAVLDVPATEPLRLETPRGSEEYVLALFSADESPAPFQVGSVGPKPVASALGPPDPGDADAFHVWLRQQERRTQRLSPAQPAVAQKPMSQRTFTVLADLSGSSYARVDATLRYSSASVMIYVDDRVPASDLSDAQVNGLGNRYAGAGGSHGIVLGAFGRTSDVDGDGRVLVLLTPTVNQLTSPGSGAYVGGFFFSQDLHAVPNSNRAEILYAMVPDPTGRWGNVFAVQSTLDVLEGVLPHEMQHLISYNEHVLLRRGNPEDLWLNEGLSHLAEGLCGEMQQNTLRANRFLANPHLVSLTAGGNALAERGMSFLFLRYVADQQDAAFLEQLVQTSRTGRDNLERASGRGLDAWLRDWVAALYLDHAGLAQEPRYRYASIDLASDFTAPSTPLLDLEFPSAQGNLEPTGCRFYRLAGTTAAATDLVVDGVRALVIRIR